MSRPLAELELEAERTRTCHDRACEQPARMAIRTTRPTRTELQSRVWYDDRAAPATAVPFCKAHGLEVLAALVQELVGADAGPVATSPEAPHGA